MCVRACMRACVRVGVCSGVQAWANQETRRWGRGLCGRACRVGGYVVLRQLLTDQLFATTKPSLRDALPPELLLDELQVSAHASRHKRCAYPCTDMHKHLNAHSAHTNIDEHTRTRKDKHTWAHACTDKDVCTRCRCTYTHVFMCTPTCMHTHACRNTCVQAHIVNRCITSAQSPSAACISCLPSAAR